MVIKGDVSVAAIQDEEVWDLLYSNESVTKGTQSGYVCTLCDAPTHYPSREALWREHDFDALGDWLRSNVLNHPRLEFHSYKGGGTWACLV